MGNNYILTISCIDKAGIVAAVSGFLFENNCFIIESTQFGDPSTMKFFMRVVFSIEKDKAEENLKDKFENIAEKFAMDWHLNDSSCKMRLLLMVSKQGHCLNDLLHRYSTGSLNIEIPAVISNHPDLEKMAKWYDIPFYHLPVTAETKVYQEAKVLEIIDEFKIDLIILARYMQVLSPDLSGKLRAGQLIFTTLSYQGLKAQNHITKPMKGGVKIIGATAHYVTQDLDEGPIIEQEVIRVNHANTPEELLALGRDIESLVLSRAIQYHINRRVLLNGNKTIVFK